MKQAANVLTLSRIALTAVLVFLMLLNPFAEETTWRILCAVVFLVAALTDLFDGKIARRTGNVSDFGKFLDPVADKCLITSTFIVFAVTEYLSRSVCILCAITAIVILLRDLCVTSLRLLAASDGKVLAAIKSGKYKTFFQCITILWIFLEGVLLPSDSVLAETQLISKILLGLCMLIVIYSGISFACHYRRQTKA